MPLLPPVPRAKEICKPAIARAMKRAAQAGAGERKIMIKIRELTRVEVAAEAVCKKLTKVVKNSANFDNLVPFYRDLVDTLVDVDAIKKSLGALQWASGMVEKLSRQYRKKMRKIEDRRELTLLRKQFEARMESVVMQISGELDSLHRAGRALRDMPSVKEMPTVLIAGYPNVGKSSILKAMAGSKVKVEPYPFTTQKLLIGYVMKGHKKLQLIDTPGILDHPFAHMNKIEKRAAAALKHLGKHLLFVVDVSEACGYPLEDQIGLMEALQGQLSPDMMVVLNKKDLADKSQLKRAPEGMLVSANSEEDMQELLKKVFDWMNF